MEKVTVVPKLRFPEFSEDWEVSRLDNFILFQAGYAFDSADMLNEPSNYQLIKMSNVYQSQLSLDRNATYWDFISEKIRKFILMDGDTVLTLTGTVGKRDYGYSVIIKESNKYLLNQRLVRLRSKNFASDSNFICMIASTERFLYHFFSNSKGGTGNQSNVSVDDLKSILLPFPKLIEQQKIAAFLTAVDDKIQQLTHKKALLEKYKKGVSQKLFNQEIRFKDDDANEYPAWEVRSLGEMLIESRLGGNYSNSETKTDFPLIKMGNLGRGKFNLNKIEFIEDGQEINFKDKICFGDLFFNTRNTLDLVGKVAVWKNELNEAYYNSNLMFMKFQNNFFMNYLFNSYHGLKSLKSIATGTTSVAAIYTKDLFKLHFSVPSVDEQKKIADFLSVLDQKIDLINIQLQKTQSFKKGLLQQMFV